VFVGRDHELRLPDATFSYQDAFARAVTELIGLVASHETGHRCGMDIGVHITRVLAAAVQSHRSKRPVELRSLQ
jgi:hypothetical protein